MANQTTKAATAAVDPMPTKGQATDQQVDQTTGEVLNDQPGTAALPAVQQAGGQLANQVVDDNLLATTGGEGMEGVRASDKTLPFMIILQSGSPQVKKTEADYVPGAEEGMFFNTVTKKFSRGIFLIPCYFELVLIEWKTDRSGMVKMYDRDDAIAKTAVRSTATTGPLRNKDVLPNGNILNPHYQHYCLEVDSATMEVTPVIVGMTGSQIKKSRQWNGAMGLLKIKLPDGRQVTPATFSHIYKCTTVAERNDDGSWWGWQIENAGRVSDAQLFFMAKAFHDEIRLSGGRVAPLAESDEHTAAVAAAKASGNTPY